jgi:two-component system, OmpR family, sensor histidine kinase KdpD
MYNNLVRRFFPQAFYHLLSIVLVAITTIPLYLLRDFLSVSTVALLHLIPVLISAIIWGLSPGLLAGFFAFLSFNYFFLTPYYTLTVTESQDFIALVIFFFMAALISQLVGRAKKNLDTVSRREEELAHLYGLHQGLVGVTGMKEILEVLAARTMETFQAECVLIEVSDDIEESLDTPDHKPVYKIRLGESPTADPLIAKLQTSQRVLGKVKLWRKNPLLQVEELLLRTFAAQGALVIERAGLAQAESRAQLLGESDRLKSVLLSSVSHELRTPLSTIKAAVTSLLDGSVDWNLEVRNELLDVINEETDQLNHLVGNLLDMTRIEAGALKPNKQWNILSEMIHRVITQMHRSVKKHQILVDAPEGLPLVPIDDIQMEQVFKNLFSNSLKYAPEGSTISVEVWEEGGATLYVRMTNQGPPVAPEHLDRIFNKFYRIQHAEKVSGTGLGLSICKGIIEAHGGRIWAENRSGGFSFCFTLPLFMDGAPPPVVDSEGV